MAVKAICQKCLSGDLTIEDISEETISEHLSTQGLPDPDLLIRTGGESRLSNFLLWQASYSEIYVTETHWPEFRKQNLIEAICDYQSRQRRFGRTGDQLKKLNTI
jgi:undecaprenyl diphosphate synthase